MEETTAPKIASPRNSSLSLLSFEKLLCVIAKVRRLIDLNLYPIYKRVSNNVTQGYSIPISGKGLWGTMFGYFSIESDGATAKGITFYAHKETPGLGGEEDKAWFQNNFIGKKFINEKGDLIGIKVVKGKADPSSDYEVDGISGATITSKGLESFLVEDLKKYESLKSESSLHK